MKEEGKEEKEEKKRTIAVESEAGKKLGANIDEILRTPAGRAVWAYIFHLCGYNTSSLVARTDGEIAVLSTECMAAQRLIYIRLRNRASKELLTIVEQLAEEPVFVVPKPKPEKEERK